ncbi:MAG: dioxygenase [Actinomycetota bacterium]|nr:dioxygenase [Actinomycetota bacterium]
MPGNDQERGGPRLTRRQLAGASLAGSAALVIAACGGSQDSGTTTAAAPAGGTTLDPTPACGHGDATLEQTEGPFFAPDSPERSSLLEPGIAGAPLVLAGRVLDTSCRPIPGALLDFWQADGEGAYDNDGYRLRGHQFADAGGRYRLETVVPGLYEGRTRHLHVKAQPQGGALLTTQLYLPREPANGSDPIFDPALLLTELPADGGSRARFDFVLQAG